MGRALRFDPSGGWHHVMNRGVDHQRIFFAACDGQRFLDLVGNASEQDRVEVHAYCLMTNHFHLLVHCPDAGLPEFMHRLGSRYARNLNDRLGRDGPIFRGRYRSLPIMSDGYLRNAGRYIHRNPVDIRPVVGLDDYRWSSYGNYCGRVPPPAWLHRDELLSAEGGLEMHRLGVERDEFGPDDDTIAWAIETAIAESDLSGSRATASRRAAALLIAGSAEGKVPEALDAWLTFPTEAARRSTLSRARKRATEDSEFAGVLRRVSALAACRFVPGTK